VIDDGPGLSRFIALSDAIFAVIITIMVLALRPPDEYDLHALLGLWPDAVSYAVSYLFIAVVWLNHHHVLGYARRLTAVLAWSNFANLFAISLIPFTTEWLAASRVASLPQTAYAAVFLLVELTYIVLMYEALRQNTPSPEESRARKALFIRAWIMVGVFTFAACATVVPAGVRLALTATFLLVHVRPSLLREAA
jgi:uncharacterized membrane protein